MSAAAREVAAIVPAAGRSRRMGRDKLLLPWGGTVVLGSVTRALAAGGAPRVVVVSSPDNEALRDWVRRSGHELAINPRPERGMLSSILEGLEHLGGASAVAASAGGLLICPGDHAGLESSTVRRLCAAIGSGAELAVPVYRRRRGHPLAIAAPLAPRIAGLDMSAGLRQLLADQTLDLREVRVEDAAVIRDLDTPADFEVARATLPEADASP